MTAPGPQSTPSKRSRRLRAAGKLTAMVGVPLAVLCTIFAAGLYVGATRSYRVQVFEARYLGYPEPSGAPETAPSLPQWPVLDAPATPEAPEATQPQPSVDPTLPPAKTDEPPKPRPTPVEPEPERPDALAVAKVEPVGDELRAKFDASRTVHVKLMIDPALAAARPDWPSYTDELFTAVRDNFSALFGISLHLQGVVVWSAAEDSPPTELGARLATHERDGAELILALVARAQPTRYEAPVWTEAVHGDHGLVFAELERSDPYYHSMLRTLARLFGAQASAEPGSFMSPGGSPAGAPPVLDPSNRGQVLFHKQRPFARPDPASPDTDTETEEQ